MDTKGYEGEGGGAGKGRAAKGGGQRGWGGKKSEDI